MKITPRILKKIYNTLLRKYGHRQWWPGDSPFEIILGAILTQNTSWKNVEKAMAQLKRHHVLDQKIIRRMPEKELARLIRPAGYFNVKANRIKHFLNFLYQRHRGSLGRMFAQSGHVLRKELLEIKGIGPETADSILLYAGNKPFFVVDAYTKRIFSRHGFFSENTPYGDVQSLLMRHLPAQTALFNDYHAQIVNIGNAHCFKTNPDCDSCPLNFLFSQSSR